MGRMSADPEDQASPEQPSQDDMKRKFREALEAKKGRHGEDHLDGGQQAGHAHGRIETKRTFRRKTG
jgi:hypothetical protein